MKLKLTIVVVVSLWAIAQPSVVNGQEPTYLALEVSYNKARPPSYVAVRSKSRGGGVWFGGFQRLPNWKEPSGQLPVFAVDVRPVLIGEKVQVAITLFLGAHHEEDRQLATYALGEYESATVRELADFGVVPFEIRVVPLSPPGPLTPQFASRVQAIELVTIESNQTTLPSFKLTLRNTSSKTVSALYVQVLEGAKPFTSGLPHGIDGLPLIPAGGVYELSVPAKTVALAKTDGYEPFTPRDQTVLISSAVFDDGSFEGAVEPAAEFRGFVMGRKTQLRRIIDVLNTVIESDAESSTNTLALLREQLSKLDVEPKPEQVREVLSQFDAAPAKPERDPRIAIQVAMSAIKRSALAELAQFASTDPNPKAIRTWLFKSKIRYETWLARLAAS